MWLIHPKKDREAPVTNGFKLAALVAIFCFVAGFALPGHAQQAPSYRQTLPVPLYRQAPQVLLNNQVLLYNQAALYNQAPLYLQEPPYFDSQNYQVQTYPDVELGKYKKVVDELKRYNAALEKRVKELEDELSACEAQKDVPKTP